MLLVRKAKANLDLAGDLIMGFWIFMTLMDLLIPVTMIGFGRSFMRKPPENINPWHGYRTRMSMKNRDTWEFAHRCAGKVWFATGWIVLLLTIPAMLLLLGHDENTIGTVGGIICLAQCVPMAAVTVPTEIALRKNFDKQGNRREAGR